MLSLHLLHSSYWRLSIDLSMYFSVCRVGNTSLLVAEEVTRTVDYRKGKILVVIVVVNSDSFERNFIKRKQFRRHIGSIRKKGQAIVAMWSNAL